MSVMLLLLDQDNVRKLLKLKELISKRPLKFNVIISTPNKIVDSETALKPWVKTQQLRELNNKMLKKRLRGEGLHFNR